MRKSVMSTVMPQMAGGGDESDEEDNGECWRISNISRPNTPHFCRSCMLGFRDRILLNNHLKMHTSMVGSVGEQTVETTKQRVENRQYRCLNCKEVFSSASQLILHSETCQTSEAVTYQCYVCEEVFEDKVLLQAHFNSMHGDKNIIAECPQCQLVFDNEDDLKIHVEIDHEDGNSPMKSFGRGRKDEVYVTVACDCGKVFINEFDYQEHMVEEHPGIEPIEWPKDLDKQTKKRGRSRGRYLTPQPPRKKLATGTPGSSQPRRKRGPTKSKLGSVIIPQERYMKEPNDEGGQCVECGQEFSKSIELKRHMQQFHQHIKPYACSLCGRRFTRKSDVKRHIETIHGQAVSKEDLDRIQAIRPFRCAKCGNPFGRYNDVKKHIETYHGLPFSPDMYVYQLEKMDEMGLAIGTSGEQVNVRTFDCGLCKRKYRNKTTVRHHIRRDHNQEEPDAFITRSQVNHNDEMECQFCGDIFNTPEEKLDHVQRIHQIVEECGDIMSNVPIGEVIEQEILRTNDDADDDCMMSEPVKDVSTPEKQSNGGGNQIVILKQELINNAEKLKESSWGQTLMHDIVTESSKPSGPFDCMHCSRTFTKQRALQHHVAKMHGSKDDEFECEICGKSYKHQAQFVKHLKIAHPEVTSDANKDDKPSVFLCPHCPKSFDVEAVLETHISVDHGVSASYSSPSRPTGGDADAANTTATTPSRATTSGGLDTTGHHISSPMSNQGGGLQAVAVSSDVRLEYYTCSICNAMFSSTESLKRHTNLRHKDEPINSPQRSIARASTTKDTLPVVDTETAQKLSKNDEGNDVDMDQSNVSLEYT